MTSNLYYSSHLAFQLFYLSFLQDFTSGGLKQKFLEESNSYNYSGWRERGYIDNVRSTVAIYTLDYQFEGNDYTSELGEHVGVFVEEKTKAKK